MKGDNMDKKLNELIERAQTIMFEIVNKLETVSGYGIYDLLKKFSAGWRLTPPSEDPMSMEELAEYINKTKKDPLTNEPLMKENEIEMDLKEFLLRHTNANDFVWISHRGWYIGCTIIDHEDLFIGSLHPELLDKKVKSHAYKKEDWITRPVLVVEIE